MKLLTSTRIPISCKESMRILFHERKRIVTTNHTVHLPPAFILQLAELASAHIFVRAPSVSHVGDIPFANTVRSLLALPLVVGPAFVTPIAVRSAEIVHYNKLSSSIAQIRALTTIVLKTLLLNPANLIIDTPTCALIVSFRPPVSGISRKFPLLDSVGFIFHAPHIVAILAIVSPGLPDFLLPIFHPLCTLSFRRLRRSRRSASWAASWVPVGPASWPGSWSGSCAVVIPIASSPAPVPIACAAIVALIEAVVEILDINGHVGSVG
mmetsp:Transcript_18786/g.33993  ORF Transcript_18786/g.33993 Transcript_18786/m.33993 type:complete len:267 (+) Transcript_18786:78-878(+)